MLSTDVLAVASIAGCAALSAGATVAILQDGPSMSRNFACELLVKGHAPGLEFSDEGSVFMITTGAPHEIGLWTDYDGEKCRRRRRHRQRVQVETNDIFENVMWNAPRARVRMEPRFEADIERAEAADRARAFESSEGAALQDRFDDAVRHSDVRVRVRRPRHR